MKKIFLLLSIAATNMLACSEAPFHSLDVESAPPPAAIQSSARNRAMRSRALCTQKAALLTFCALECSSKGINARQKNGRT